MQELPTEDRGSRSLPTSAANKKTVSQDFADVSVASGSEDSTNSCSRCSFRYVGMSSRFFSLFFSDPFQPLSRYSPPTAGCAAAHRYFIVSARKKDSIESEYLRTALGQTSVKMLPTNNKFASELYRISEILMEVAYIYCHMAETSEELLLKVRTEFCSLTIPHI